MLIQPGRKRRESKGAAPGAPKPPPSAIYTFKAPFRGWVTNENLAEAQPGAASVLDNWWPERFSMKVRGGHLKYATVHATDPCETLMTYVSGTASKLFASTAAAVYEISNPADPDVVPSAEFSGQANGDYSWTNVSTAGGEFLYIANGADKPRLYDGAAWTAIDGASTPAITGVTTTALDTVWLFKSFVFFSQKNTLNAWYLPVDSVGGAATKVSLQGVFKQGGNIKFGASLSTDAGSGPDDYCVFVSSLGEIAVYQGASPASWGLVGVFAMPAPLHKNGWIKAGGNLLILTELGLIPLTAAMKKDPAAISTDAASLPIEPTWQKYVDDRPGKWCIGKWTKRGKALVGFPEGSETAACFTVNLQTQGWSRFTGWDMRCCVELGGDFYFGTSDGKVMKAEAIGSDNGAMYRCLYVGLHERLGGPAQEKAALQCRGTWRATTSFNYKISFGFNYSYKELAYPTVPAETTTDLWDVGLWDVALWDAGGVEHIETEWRSVYGHGFAVAPVVQVACGTTTVPKIEFISADLLYETGALVT
jgi:hypothetical protein